MIPAITKMRTTLFISFSLFLLSWAGDSQESDPASADAPVVRKETVKTVHVFVALCDNEHQGIVPVPEALGNGEDPKNNLYWGALYGTKRFLEKSSSWVLVNATAGSTPAVLERAVFKHRTMEACLVADAYRGSEIKTALTRFFDAAAGNNRETIPVGEDCAGIHGDAGLLVYVGHNGLMDFSLKKPERADSRTGRDAIVLACKSKPHFLPRLSDLGCRPVLLTTGFMAPEAYTLEAAVEGWLSGADGEAIRERAASAYDRYQECGLNRARRLFFSEE